MVIQWNTRQNLSTLIQVKMLVTLWESINWGPAGVLEMFRMLIRVVVKHVHMRVCVYVCVLKNFSELSVYFYILLYAFYNMELKK